MALSTLAWIKRLSMATAVTLALSGCDMYKLEELRHTTPSGTPFQDQLSQLYMDYATTAEKHYDWLNSWHFADKGLMLAYGKDIPPEDLKDWDIPASVLPEMAKARIALMAVLNSDLPRVRPALAAEAQFYFDCWVKEQEQNWREEQIAYCRDNLIRTLGELNASSLEEKTPADAPVSPAPAARKPKKAPHHESHAAAEKPKKEPAREAAKETKEPAPRTTSYAVFFEPDKAEVSEPGMNVITEVIKSLREAPDYAVILHPGKDHPGKAAERIEVVKKLLVAGGVNESAIRIASGKTEAETGKPVSRRVEIFLNE